MRIAENRGSGADHSSSTIEAIGWALVVAALWPAVVAQFAGFLDPPLRQVPLAVSAVIVSTAWLTISLLAARVLIRLTSAPPWIWAGVAVVFGLEIVVALPDLVRPAFLLPDWLFHVAAALALRVAVVVGMWLGARRNRWPSPTPRG